MPSRVLPEVVRYEPVKWTLALRTHTPTCPPVNVRWESVTKSPSLSDSGSPPATPPRSNAATSDGSVGPTMAMPSSSLMATLPLRITSRTCR